MIWVDIRPCTGDDTEAMSEIDMASSSTPWPHEVFMADMEGRGEPCVYMCAVTSLSVVCGFIALQTMGGEMWIMNLAVSPEYRRMGVGLKLVGAADIIAQEEGVRRIRLHVRVSNDGACRFYEFCGFDGLGEKQKYYEDGETALEMASPVPLPFRLF